MSEYLLDKEFNEAKERLAINEQVQDPATIEYLEKINIGNDWNCLEIGGGAGSITSWLCEKVGENGRVTVIDLEPRFLEQLNYNNLQILKEDISKYDFGVEKYDLIHGRDILIHIENRDDVLRNLSKAVKLNGWILLEEADVSVDMPDPAASEDEITLYKKVTKCVYRFLKNSGLDPYYGAKLLGMLRNSGFNSLYAEGRVRMFIGGDGLQKSPHMMAFGQLKEAMVSGKYLSKKEFDDFLELSKNKNFAWREGLTMSVMGKKTF
jgi:ubiquinone/menaquinone biosynthesis C-methylase UbiE